MSRSVSINTDTAQKQNAQGTSSGPTEIALRKQLEQATRRNRKSSSR